MEAEAAHRGFERVPTLPCAIHGRPVLLPEYAIAWEIYQIMRANWMFIVREKALDLNYQAPDMLLRYYAEPAEHGDIFAQLHIIHDEIFGDDD